MDDQQNRDTFGRGGKWLIAGILASFSIGVVFFLTLAMQRSGDPIPPDAGPLSKVRDAG